MAEVSWEASWGVSVKCLPCCVELFPVPDPVEAVSFCRNCLPGIHSFCGSLTSPYQAPEDADAGLVHVRLPLPLRQQHIRFSRDPAGVASTGVLGPASQAPLTAVSQPNADACHRASSQASQQLLSRSRQADAHCPSSSPGHTLLSEPQLS